MKILSLVSNHTNIFLFCFIVCFAALLIKKKSNEKNTAAQKLDQNGTSAKKNIKKNNNDNCHEGLMDTIRIKR